MADTDKTKPLWVLLADGTHASQAVHAPHLPDAPCDLPEKPGRGNSNTRCRWFFRYTGKQVCACPMCKRYAFDVAPSRRERREQRRVIDEQLRDG
jgi:hypothetical protein